MGNHARRVRVARLLKERGLPGLYKGCKFAAYNRISPGDLKEMELNLRWKPGDVVNDCDVFNHVVVGYRYSRGLHGPIGSWTATCFQVVFEDGSWSCGCSRSPCPAWTREAIEKIWLKISSDKEDLEHWSAGYQSYCDAIRVQLESGGHICDERGIQFPEFRRKP